MTTAAVTPTTRTGAGWRAKAEFALLDKGSYGLTVAHKPTRQVRVVMNQDADPDALAKGMVSALWEILLDVGPDAAAAAADAIAQILGGNLDAVAVRLHAMAALPDEVAR